jgi:hypothetical protein
MIQLSMLDANDFIESAMLDGILYRLHYGWNSYSQQWSVDIRTAQNKDIVRGIAIVPNMPLFNQCRRNGLPKGELMAVTVNQDDTDNQQIGRDDFIDGRFAMVYVPEAEKNAIMEATVSCGIP